MLGTCKGEERKGELPTTHPSFYIRSSGGMKTDERRDKTRRTELQDRVFVVRQSYSSNQHEGFSWHVSEMLCADAW